MECDRCGAARPRSGPCPNCGAPPPGTYSSMRQWRDQARTGKGPAVGRGSSGKNPAVGRSSGGRSPGSGGDWRTGGSGGDWRDAGEYDYDDAPPQGSLSPSGHMTPGSPPSRSNPRHRRLNDYDEVDLERALVPAQGGALAMDPAMGGVALPGLPETDEAERALGIRRPVYIPAVEGKRKRKLGTWRVVSGVLSVMLVCVASCALAGLLGRNQLASFLQGPQRGGAATPGFSTANVPVTPVATPGAASNHITGVVTAQGFSTEGAPINRTSHFMVGETVWVIATVRGATQSVPATVSIRWYLDNTYLSFPPVAGTTSGCIKGTGTSCTINSDRVVRFNLTVPQAGAYQAKLYYNLPASDQGDSPTDQFLG
ncbi:MAG TPA: hypothetical protein VGS80_00910, partial [Ktedonobacterales bacterium]|nr:hypothetical protein [Ktedonobacterales bacterium]